MQLNSGEFNLGKFSIDKNNPFFVAEIGSNHDGKLDKAKQLIYEAKCAGAHSVKFQFFNASDLVSESNSSYSMLSDLALPYEWIVELYDYSASLDLTFFGSPFNVEILNSFNKFDIPIVKVASSELLNTRLLLAVSKLNIPVMLSLGMSEWYEVEIAIKILRSINEVEIIPMHCVSLYPAKFDEINLGVISHLISRFEGIIGFSDHTESCEIGAWAYCLGARVFEKHLTLNRTDSGPDHSYAMEPSQFKIYIDNIKNAQESMRYSEKYYVGDEIRGRHRNSLKPASSLKSGELLEFGKLSQSNPRVGIPANLIHYVQNLKSLRDIDLSENINWKDLI